MNRRALGSGALALLSLLAGAILLAQLSQRADRAADLVSPIRNDIRQVTVLLDRATGTGVLDAGWSTPVLGQGVTSNAAIAGLHLPTSTAAGDVELILVLASSPRAPDQSVTVRVGATPVGTWTPHGDREETLRFIVPSKVRSTSYQLDVGFDLPGAPPPPIRALSASMRVLRAP